MTHDNETESVETTEEAAPAEETSEESTGAETTELARC